MGFFWKTAIFQNIRVFFWKKKCFPHFAHGTFYPHPVNIPRPLGAGFLIALVLRCSALGTNLKTNLEWRLAQIRIWQGSYALVTRCDLPVDSDVSSKALCGFRWLVISSCGFRWRVESSLWIQKSRRKLPVDSDDASKAPCGFRFTAFEHHRIDFWIQCLSGYFSPRKRNQRSRLFIALKIVTKRFPCTCRYMNVAWKLLSLKCISNENLANGAGLLKTVFFEINYEAFLKYLSTKGYNRTGSVYISCPYFMATKLKCLDAWFACWLSY